MEPSTALKALYVRICRAMSDGDHSFFKDTFSQEDGVLAIGTDPAEWWVGYPEITRVFTAQLQEMDNIKVLPDTPMAWCDGSVGWVAGRPTLEIPDGTKLTVRLTVVFQRDQNEWKIVQWHFSGGISNEDFIGDSLTP